jgi:diketogulonate reductase-like aldo/keto reductase
MQIPGPMVWGEPNDPDRVRKVLRRVVDLGIRLIDTSWYYGPLVANRFICETLHPYPKDLVLVTKLGGRRTPDRGWASALTPAELFRGCDEDLRTLKLDRIDLVHLRWIEPSEVAFGEALDAMIELRRRGKIRHIGISNVTLAQLDEAMERTTITSVENLYNVAAGERRLDVPGMQVAGQEELVDRCTQKGIAFFPFFSLAVFWPEARGAGHRRGRQDPWRLRVPGRAGLVTGTFPDDAADSGHELSRAPRGELECAHASPQPGRNRPHQRRPQLGPLQTSRRHSDPRARGHPYWVQMESRQLEVTLRLRLAWPPN